jgi:hypothetical protein
LILLLVGLLTGTVLSTKKETKKMAELSISSPAFKTGEFIPSQYTCQGEDVNPALVIKNIPAATKSLVLIVDDPDAVSLTWDHWLIFNIPAQVTEIEEGQIPVGSLLGKNTLGNLEYSGPCPPPGKPHRYFFKLYALDTVLALKAGATKREIETAMAGHILSQATLIGLYKRR